MSLFRLGFACQSGADLPPKKKQKPSEKEEKRKKSDCGTTAESKPQRSQDSFRTAWLSQFDWLIFDKESQTMKCYVCTDANLPSCSNKLSKNKFVWGSVNLKHSASTRHEKSSDHQDAIRARQRRVEMRKSVQKVEEISATALYVCVCVCFAKTNVFKIYTL